MEGIVIGCVEDEATVTAEGEAEGGNEAIVTGQSPVADDDDIVDVADHDSHTTYSMSLCIHADQKTRIRRFINPNIFSGDCKATSRPEQTDAIRVVLSQTVRGGSTLLQHGQLS